MGITLRIRTETAEELWAAIAALSSNADTTAPAKFETVKKMPPPQASEPKKPSANKAETVSLEALREKVIALTDAGKRDGVKAALKVVGAERVPEISEEKRNEFLNALNEL